MYVYSNVGDWLSNRTVQAGTNTLQQAVRTKIINDDEVVSNPVKCVAGKLTVNVVAVVVPKINTDNIIKFLNKLNIKVLDICIEPINDYYEFKKIF